MQQRKLKWNNPYRIAGILLIMVVLTVQLLSGMYARFVSTDQSESSARVAKFSVTPGEVTNIDLSNMAPGESRSYEFTVAYSGEVAVDYLVDLTGTANLPLTYTVVRKNSANTPAEATVNAESSALVETVAPGDDNPTFVLTVEWQDTAQNRNSQYNALIDVVSLVFTVSQHT